MRVIVDLPDCNPCRHLSHSGAFTPGGAQSVCDHDGAVNCATKVNVPEEGEDKFHWKYRVLDPKKTPKWCPLKFNKQY